jgi:hypothetical protein
VNGRRDATTHEPTPSGKIQLYSGRAMELGLPPLPMHEAMREVQTARVSAQILPGTHDCSVPRHL